VFDFLNLFFKSKKEKDRSNSLDLLRFILAIWVLFSHSFFWATITETISNQNLLYKLNLFFSSVFQRNGETHPAVLGFIFLSGYCIHRNGFRFESKISFKSFFIKRSFRILPVYWLGIILGFVLFKLSSNLNTPIAQALSGTNSINMEFLILKIFGVSSFIPFFHFKSFQGNAPLTTVMVEIWLYISYAFIFFLSFRKRTLKNIFYVFMFFWAAMFLCVHFFPIYEGWWHNGSFISFSLYWWMGAFFVEIKNKKSMVSSPYLISASGFFVILSPFLRTLLFSELKKISLTYLFGLLILRLESHWRKTPPLLGGLGSISYSLYAFHAPLVIFLLLFGFQLIFVISIVLSVSLISYLIVEKPFLQYGKTLSKKV